MPRKVLTGELVKIIDNKTIKVKVIRKVLHPLYKKLVQKHKLYLCHDEKQVHKIGDEVSIIESPPISKRKKFTVIDAANNG